MGDLSAPPRTGARPCRTALARTMGCETPFAHNGVKGTSVTSRLTTISVCISDRYLKCGSRSVLSGFQFEAANHALEIGVILFRNLQVIAHVEFQRYRDKEWGGTVVSQRGRVNGVDPDCRPLQILRGRRGRAVSL